MSEYLPLAGDPLEFYTLAFQIFKSYFGIESKSAAESVIGTLLEAMYKQLLKEDNQEAAFTAAMKFVLNDSVCSAYLDLNGLENDFTESKLIIPVEGEMQFQRTRMDGHLKNERMSWFVCFWMCHRLGVRLRDQSKAATMNQLHKEMSELFHLFALA